MTFPNVDAAKSLDTSDHTTKYVSGRGGAPTTTFMPEGGESAAGISDGRLLQLAQEAESQSTTFFQTSVRRNWARAYKAYRSQHFADSKYLSPEYRGRSKLFRPKTRTSVIKAMANAAQALFSTGDVISVSPQNEADDYQAASAAMKQEIMNYRLSRTSRRNGIRWFQIAMGAVQTANITGIVISKQSWRYREDDSAASFSPEGFKMNRPAVLEDRPSIDLCAPENVLFDPNVGDWTNPAQSSQYLMLRNVMSVDEAMTMIEQQIASGNTQFRRISKSVLAAKAQSNPPVDTTTARVAREGGRDPIIQVSGAFGRIWVYEVFMRIGNLDYVFWTLNNQMLLSDPVPVRKAYPHLSGERPVVIGFGTIEAFRPYPQSKVEALQNLQMELNDQVNLRTDHMKNVVTPPAKVRRGRKVDLTQVQKHGPNRIVMVQDMEDVEYWQPPDVPNSAFVENQILTADFDTLAGVFDQGSVANNRSMNETVGGMRLLAASVNPMADYDLNVLIETWAEPVLWQVMKLEEYYENDATLLAICGEKAKLWERFGIDAITDELLTRETSFQIKLGVGVNNLPEDRLRRFANAWQITMGALAPFVQSGAIAMPTPNIKEIVDTVFGAGGFKDGGERFFKNLDMAGQPQQQGPSPEVQAKMADVQVKQQKLALDAKQMEVDAGLRSLELEQKRQESVAKIEMDHARALAEIGKAFLESQHGGALQGAQHAHDLHMATINDAHQRARDAINAHTQMAQQAAQGQMAQQQEEVAAAQAGQTQTGQGVSVSGASGPSSAETRLKLRQKQEEFAAKAQRIKDMHEAGMKRRAELHEARMAEYRKSRLEDGKRQAEKARREEEAHQNRLAADKRRAEAEDALRAAEEKRREAEHAAKMERHKKAMSPKRVMRDESGKISGIE